MISSRRNGLRPALRQVNGEVRSVSQPDLRAREAAALGFRRVVVPHGNAAEIRADIDVVAIRKIEEFPQAIF